MVEQPHDERQQRAPWRRQRTTVARACVRGLTLTGFVVTAWLFGTQAAQAEPKDPAATQPISAEGVVEVVDDGVLGLLSQQRTPDQRHLPTTCHEPTSPSRCADSTTTGQPPSAEPARDGNPADPPLAARDHFGGGHHTSMTDQPSGVRPPAGTSGVAASAARPWPRDVVAGMPTRLSAEPPSQVVGTETSRHVVAGPLDVLATVVHVVTSPIGKLPLGEVTEPVAGALVGATRQVGDMVVPVLLGKNRRGVLPPVRSSDGHRPEPGPVRQPADPSAAPRIGASTGGATPVAPSMSGSSADRRQVDSQGAMPVAPTFPVPAPLPAYPGAGLSYGGQAGGGLTSHSEAGAHATVGVTTVSDTSAIRVPPVTARLGALSEHAEDPAVAPD